MSSKNTNVLYDRKVDIYKNIIALELLRIPSILYIFFLNVHKLSNCQ